MDLPAQTIEIGGRTLGFEIEPFRKRCLLEGLDDVGLTLGHRAAIAAHEAGLRPWASPAR